MVVMKNGNSRLLFFPCYENVKPVEICVILLFGGKKKNHFFYTERK